MRKVKKPGIFLGIGEFPPPDWMWMVTTRVAYNPFLLAR